MYYKLILSFLFFSLNSSLLGMQLNPASLREITAKEILKTKYDIQSLSLCEDMKEYLHKIRLQQMAIELTHKIGCGLDVALCSATRRGTEDLIPVLIDLGAQVDSCGPGYSPLMLATLRGNEKAVRKLLAKNAQIDLQDIFGRTALMYAAREGRYDAVKEFLARDIQVDLQDLNGRTALIWAVNYGHVEIVKELLVEGARLHINNNLGETALDIARAKSELGIRSEQYQYIAKLLAEYPASVLIDGACSGKIDMIRKLLSKNVQINLQNVDGRTALMEAAFAGQYEIVEELLAKGAQLDVQDHYGATALWLAKTYGQPKIVQLIEDHQDQQERPVKRSKKN